MYTRSKLTVRTLLYNITITITSIILYILDLMTYEKVVCNHPPHTLLPHNSNYYIRPIRSTFSASTVVIRSQSTFVGVIHEVPFVLSRRTFSTVNGTARGMVL